MPKPSQIKPSMALIENIYFSINFTGNYNEWIEEKRGLFNENMQRYLNGSEEFIIDNVEVIGGIKRYPYGYSVKEKFRIYFSNKVGSNYPVYVIVSAVYLHLNNIWDCIAEVQNVFEKIVRLYEPDFLLDDNSFTMKLSRMDICNHNTFINLDTYIKPTEYNSRVVSKLRSTQPYIHLNGEEDQEVNYFRYGSNDVCIRFYNKTREICEQQYKSFFFLKWLDLGLINQKTFDVYEFTYKLSSEYRTDFLYSNVVLNDDVTDSVKNIATNIYRDLKKNNGEKYDRLKELIKNNNIKCVPEVVNVEYQLRGDFLRSVKIKDSDDSFIDYTDMFNILIKSQQLYEYCTSQIFRVVVRDKNVKCKRKREVDKLWQLIQSSQITNVFDNPVDCSVDIYREYNKNMNKLITNKKLLKSATHLFYLNNSKFTTETVDNVDIMSLLENIYNEYEANENFLNLKDMLLKQIKYYGEKK